MTRKDYVAIAEVLRTELKAQTTDYGYKAVWRVIDNMANMMFLESPRFDIDRFRKACGLNLTKVLP